ncbi:hypothetical protein CR152_01775 [Massilia violaceinigra]|uniref:Uncharacterized protein n=1 Tax=Massilia violaceinigra TaxID=2045208 RepID=A0A2D2DEG6_9BURK|nr:hypothetical protein [Massilia violaceinigra]ATQ73377.1 hypothetical protein CR152_01775 [Massilia violaceinigra]
MRFRLRWYAVSTARVLLRRWQALVLLCGILASANMSLFSNVDALATPLLVLLSPEHGAAWRFGYLMVLHAIAVMWALMQREQITGGAFMAYARSLPFTERYRRRVDTIVLVLADSPLLVPLVCALLVVSVGHGQGANFLLMLVVGLLALAAQLGALDRRRLAWIAVAAGNLLLAAVVHTPFQAGACVLVGLGACALLAMRLPRAAPRWQDAFGRAGAPLAALLVAMSRRLHPAILISAGVLFRQRRSEVIGKAMGAGCIAVAALALMKVFDHDGRAVGAAVIAQVLMALSISGLYRGLQMAHVDAAGYFAALPLRRAWWRMFDIVVVVTLALPFLAIPGVALLVHHVASPVSIIASAASSVALLCVLRVPQLFNERHAVVLSSIVAGTWGAFTIALINQEDYLAAL